MLLAIDVGNTNIEMGLFNYNNPDDFLLIESFRISTRRDYTTDDLWARVKNLINGENYDYTQVKAAIISSVVPQLNHPILKMISKYIKKPSYCIDNTIDTGITYNYKNAAEIGADRIAAAVAAEYFYKGPSIIIDLGTAITFDIINENKEYLGGCIVPGIKTSLEALVGKAARLFPVEIIPLDRVVRKTTQAGIQSGIYFSNICMIRGMIEMIKNESQIDNMKVIGTGGFSNLFSRSIPEIDIFDPNLVMKGLKVIYNRMKKFK